MLKVSDAVNGRFVSVVEDDFDFNFEDIEDFLNYVVWDYCIIDFRIIFENWSVANGDKHMNLTGTTYDEFIKHLKEIDKKLKEDSIYATKTTFELLLSLKEEED